MLIKYIFAISTLLCMFSAYPQEATPATKRDVLNAVTCIKPVQQIILDYLDIPDQLVQKYIGIDKHEGLHEGLSDTRRSRLVAFSENMIALSSIKSEADHAVEPIQLRDLITGKLARVIPHDLTLMESLAISPDSKYVAVTTRYNNHGIIFDSNTRDQVHSFNKSRSQANFTAIAFSPNSTYFAYCSNVSNSCKVEVLKLDTNQIIYTGELQYNPQHQNCPVFLVFSPTQENLVCTTPDQKIALVDIKTKKSHYLVLRDHEKSSGNRKKIEFSRNGKFLICQYASITEIVNIATDTVVGYSHTELIFEPQGKYIITNKKPSYYEPTQTIFNQPLIYCDHLAPTTGNQLSPVETHFVSGGAYLIANFNDGHEIALFQNQALDLDCKPTIITDVSKESTNSADNADKKSSCVVS